MQHNTKPAAPFHFARYVNGTEMAEGVTITNAATIEEAMVKATQLAPRGPNNEIPVLIYLPQSAPANEQSAEALPTLSNARRRPFMLTHLASLRLLAMNMKTWQAAGSPISDPEDKYPSDLFEKKFSADGILQLLDHIDAQAARIAELERTAARCTALRAAIITMKPTNDEFDAAINAAMELPCTS